VLNKLKPKSEFSRNVLTLMTGTSIAQAIPIAISPILTRIYTPEDFGVFALYMSVASILSVVATGRYELAIMLPKKDEDAINIVALSIMISFFVSFITLLIVFFFNASLTSLLGNPEISAWLYFVPLTVLLTGIYQSFNYWSNRKKEYKRLATSRVVQSGVTATTNLGMGFNGFGASGLIVGGVLGQGVATAVLGRLVFGEDKERLKSVRKLKVFALAKRYVKFPIFNLPNAIIDGLRVSGINILIAKYFVIATLGQFSLAWKMVQVPLSLIGGSLSQVFFQQIAQADKVELHSIVWNFLKKLFVISFPIFIFIYLFSGELFTFIFGEEWKLAGEAASIMAPWFLLNFLSMPMAHVFIVMNKQEVVLIVSIVYMILPIGILLIFNEYGFLNVLRGITSSMSLVLVIYIWLILFYTKKGNKCFMMKQ